MRWMQALLVGSLVFWSTATAWGQPGQLRRVTVRVSDAEVDLEIQSVAHPERVYRCRDGCELRLPAGRYLINASQEGHWAGTRSVVLRRSAVWEIDPADPEASKNWRGFATVGAVTLVAGGLLLGLGMLQEIDFDGGSGRGESLLTAGLVVGGCGAVMIPLGLGLSAQYSSMTIQSEPREPAARVSKPQTALQVSPGFKLSFSF